MKPENLLGQKNTSGAPGRERSEGKLTAERARTSEQ